jgi:hypothetical protein
MRDTLGIHNEMYVSQIVSREVRICKCILLYLAVS